MGETVLILLNAHHEPIPFLLPKHQPERHWERLIDTSSPMSEVQYFEGEQAYDLQGRSLAVYRLRERHEPAGRALSVEQTSRLFEGTERVAL